MANVADHKLISVGGATLCTGTLQECMQVAKDRVAEGKPSGTIRTIRAINETKARKAGTQAQQLVMRGIAEHGVDGDALKKAVQLLDESSRYHNYNVVKLAVANRPLTANQIAWIFKAAAEYRKSMQLGLVTA